MVEVTKKTFQKLKSPLWWRFTPSSNLFRAKLVSSAPTPVPAKLARVQPEKPPLESFLNFPPPYFFFLVERVGFSGSPPTASSGGVGASLGRPQVATLRVNTQKRVIYRDKSIIIGTFDLTAFPVTIAWYCLRLGKASTMSLPT